MQLQCNRRVKRNDEEKKEVRTKGDLYFGFLDNKRYREKYERIQSEPHGQPRLKYPYATRECNFGVQIERYLMVRKTGEQGGYQAVRAHSGNNCAEKRCLRAYPSRIPRK